MNNLWRVSRNNMPRLWPTIKNSPSFPGSQPVGIRARRTLAIPLLAASLAACADAPLSASHPGDRGLAEHPAVLFHSDFSRGLEGWQRHTRDETRLHIVKTDAVSGDQALRARIGQEHLQARANLSTFAEHQLESPQEVIYWRFHARFTADTAPPHHWVRILAERPGFHMGGRAGTRPAGDEGFSVALDLDSRDRLFFYTYWQGMRSWVCNDGSTRPGCAGRQGGPDPQRTHYGNKFHPAGQTGIPRERWFCIEMAVHANTPGEHDGRLQLWLDDTPVGEFSSGTPRGRWLRDHFRSHGRYYRDEQAFEGFDFRSDASVGIRRVSLDAYYQLDTLERQRRRGRAIAETQQIEYDAVVIATRRIGCYRP